MLARDRNSRKARGMTLIEMLVSASIVGIAGAGVAGMLMLNALSTSRLFNKVDNVNAARQAIERLSKDIRMARNLGDVYGDDVLLFPASAGPPPQPAVYGTEGSVQFPSTLDPHYNNSQNPTGGWPAAPWPIKPYTLGSRTLIIQVPVFDAGGFPTRIARDQYGPGNPATPQDNVDTVVYQVVDNPDEPGEYMLQVAGFPGSPTALRLATSPPQTMLKGIVGPKDPATQQLKIFQFLAKTKADGSPDDSVQITFPPSNGPLALYTGLLVNLELKSHQSGEIAKSTIGLKAEIYMRNNTLSQVSSSD